MPVLTESSGYLRTRDRPDTSPWMLFGAFAAGAVAIALLVVAQQANPKHAFVAYSGVVLLVLLPLVGDFRLFCLYAILMLAPLNLRLSFLHYPHMGGAGGLIFEGVDPFLALLLFIQIRERVKGFRNNYRIPPALIPWLVLIGLGVGSMIFATMRMVAFLEVVRMLKVTVLALVIVNELVRRRDFQHAIAALLVGVILEAMIALVQTGIGRQLGLQYLGESTNEEIKLLGETSLEGGEFVYRAGALIGHANLFAAYLALYLPVAIALVLSTAPRLLKALSIVALVVGPPALVLTLSRTGWADFVAALAIVVTLGALHPDSRQRFKVARIAIVAAVVAVGIALSPMIIKRLQQADPSSVQYRLKWINTAKAMIYDNPVFGVGLNSYVYAQIPYGEYRTPVEMTEFYGEVWPVVHNSWLIVWTEQGTVGFVIWVAFNLCVIGVGIRNLRIRDPVMHALSVGLLAGFVAIMIDGIASFFVRQEATARMFWIATAMIMAISYWRRINEDEARAPRAKSVPLELRPANDAPAQGRWLPVRASRWL